MAFMDDISKKNKLNNQISEKEREINKLFAQIGQQYYALHKLDAEPALEAMVKAVDEAKAAIQRNQERLDFANGVTQCPNCGTENIGSYAIDPAELDFSSSNTILHSDTDSCWDCSWDKDIDQFMWTIRITRIPE